jgi:hypothetical protein
VCAIGETVEEDDNERIHETNLTARAVDNDVCPLAGSLLVPVALFFLGPRFP